MAVLYIKSGATGAANGSSWTDAFTTLGAALTAGAAGDTFYVSHLHSETTASALVLTIPGTEVSPSSVLCVNDGAEPPVSLATTALIVTTGANALTVNGHANIYGITFLAGTSSTPLCNLATINDNQFLRFTRCVVGIGDGGSSAARVLIGNTNAGGNAQSVEFNDSQLRFSHSGQNLRPRCDFYWHGTAVPFSNLVTTPLFPTTAISDSRGARVVIGGVDFSQMDGGTLVDMAGSGKLRFLFDQCRLHANTIPVNNFPVGAGGASFRMVDCGSSTSTRRYRSREFEGDIYSEKTVLRTGGGAEGRRMVTTANAKFFSPLAADVVGIFNAVTGTPITATIEIVNDGDTLTDGEIWIEGQYLGNSGYPISSFISDRKADILATATNQEGSSVDWTTTGISSPIKQKLSITFTPQLAGVLKLRVNLAKVSKTVYFDPVPVIT